MLPRTCRQHARSTAIRHYSTPASRVRATGPDACGPARAAVVLLHGPLLAEVELGLDEAFCDQLTHRHGVLLRLVSLPDDSTMPG